MFAELFLAATIIFIWVAFTEDRPEVIVVKKYYYPPAPRTSIEMQEFPSQTEPAPPNSIEMQEFPNQT